MTNCTMPCMASGGSDKPNSNDKAAKKVEQKTETPAKATPSSSRVSGTKKSAARPNNSRRPWFNREVFGWAMFDFANQAFTLVILTTMFQIYFVEFIVPGVTAAPTADASQAIVDQFEADKAHGRQLWRTAIIISQVFVILLSPLIGALADFSGAKKKLLLITYVGCVLFTALLGVLTPGMVVLAMVLFIIGYLFYATGENFLGAFLPELCAHRDMGKVSAFGFTLGYTGGLVCLMGATVILGRFELVTGYRLICLWAAVFFLCGGLPTMLLLKEKKLAEQMPQGKNMFTIGFWRVGSTFAQLKQYRHLLSFLGIMIFYIAGMQVIIFMGGTIAKELFNLSEQQLGIYLIVITVCAIIGAFVTSLYQDRIGTRNTIILALILWSGIMIAALFLREAWKDYAIIQALFWVVGGFVGFGMGMLGTSSRAMVGLFSPQHKAAEFFGFYGLSHKLAAILGLGLNLIAERVFAGQFNLVVASTGVFFIGGIVMMMFVDEKTGRVVAIKAAREHNRKHHDLLVKPE